MLYDVIHMNPDVYILLNLQKSRLDYYIYNFIIFKIELKVMYCKFKIVLQLMTN